MNRAQQAAEKRYPQSPDRGLTYPFEAVRQAAGAGFIEGTNWALPETLDPAVIEAMVAQYDDHMLGENWGDDGVGFVGCDCGQWFGKASEGGWDRAKEHVAYAAYAALRKAVLGG